MESYTPIPYDFRDVLEEQIAKRASGKIFFWSEDDKVDEQAGCVVALDDQGAAGIFARLDHGPLVRVDRIITLFGKPGPGYEAYDAFANQCLACTAGVPL